MKTYLAVDFGSTFTKLVLLDLSNEEIIGKVQVPSTVDSDITIGLERGLKKLKDETGINLNDISVKLACSSAAGGLRVVAIGLVEALTVQAAKEAALGSGAKIVGLFSNGLTESDVQDIFNMRPDIILLSGGTDGGNTEVIINNAQMLAQSRLDVPIIIAGNKMAGKQIANLLADANKTYHLTENVLPKIDQLNCEPVRNTIRDIFINRIIVAKGINKAARLIGSVVMPTPLAVFRAFTLLSLGSGQESGLGELLGISIGGATIDVCSIAEGNPNQPGVLYRGIPEPVAKRTVEGDLGIRYNCRNLVEAEGDKNISLLLKGLQVSKDFKVEDRISYLSSHVSSLPESSDEKKMDVVLAQIGVDLATRRHAGILREVPMPSGIVLTQQGKDLINIKAIIGTGGIMAYGYEPKTILEAACFNSNRPESLRPKTPDFFVDRDYVLFAVGLLSEMIPDKAFRIGQKSITKI